MYLKVFSNGKSNVYTMVLLSLGFSLILGILVRFTNAEDIDAFTTEPQRSESEALQVLEKQLCNFNENPKTNNITDLLLCMDNLAQKVLLQQTAKQNGITNRVYQDTWQSHPSYAPSYAPVFPPDYSIPSQGPAFSNHYGADTISPLLSEGLPIPGLSNLFGLNSYTRPSFNLFNALSSIARHDDLKCISRIICEVASGSIPGSYGYRQNTAFQGSRLITLFRLLTAFNLAGSSPILTFGRAAIIGYTNRGKSYLCYREYPKCPQNTDQLISYLNTYNGGFFRFFGIRNDNYYRPQPPPYFGYNRNSDVQGENFQLKSEYNSEKLLSPESTETQTLTFENDKYYQQENDDIDKFSIKQRESESGKVIFPDDKQESHSGLIGIAKSLGMMKNSDINNNEEISLLTNHNFFEESKQRNMNIEPFNQIYYNQKPHIDIFQDKTDRLLLKETSNKDTSTFVFPNS